MKRVRQAIVVVGVLSPYLARIPGMFTEGVDWMLQYVQTGVTGFLFIAAFNAVAWGAVLLASLAYRHPSSVGYPAVLALASNLWLHGAVDLASDAQAAIALLVIPFMTLPFTATGFIVGWWIDRRKPAAA